VKGRLTQDVSALVCPLIASYHSGLIFGGWAGYVSGGSADSLNGHEIHLGSASVNSDFAVSR